MPSPNPAVRERRFKEWELYVVKGMTYREIGAQFNLAHTVIEHDLKMIEEERWADIRANAGPYIARNAYAYWHIFREAMAAWERSKTEGRKVEKGRKTSKPGSPETTTGELTKETGPGDPRFLAEGRAALQAMERIIPGMIAPTVHELTAKDGRPLFPLDKFDELFERDDFNDILSGRNPFLSIAGPSGNGHDGQAGTGGNRSTIDVTDEPVDSGDAGGNGKPGPLDAGAAPGDH